jgi:hypothetical protein
VAFLGLPSVRRVHVRFDGVCSESLCRRRAGRIGDGDAGLRYRQSHNENAKRDCGGEELKPPPH